MIKKEYFFKGYKSILKVDSPAIALGCCFIAIGALLKNIGFNIQESIISTMLIYALPGSLVMAESILVGASLLSIFIAVWFVNARFYPMAGPMPKLDVLELWLSSNYVVSMAMMQLKIDLATRLSLLQVITDS